MIHQLSIGELSDLLRQTKPKIIGMGEPFEKGEPKLYSIEELNVCNYSLEDGLQIFKPT
jgi:hypothetical protein